MIRIRRILLHLLSGLAAGAALLPTGASADDSVWRALRAGGHAVLIRHATAPGTGDPPGFRIGDCSTQRNLSDDGREQARRIGAALRANGVRIDRVLSSRWCRASETASLLDLGTVEPFPPLDSFFGEPARSPEAVAGMAGMIESIGARTIVMVTHQVNITALTGIHPASGEAVVVAPADGTRSRIRVVGRLTP